MLFEYVTLKVGERIQEGDLVYVPSRQRYETVGNTSFCTTVAPGSVYMRPVTRSASKSDRREWEEEEKEAGEEEAPTLQEELTKTNEYLQRVLKENMDLHNEAHGEQGHVDSLKKQLAALEEKMHAAEKLHDQLMMQARAERLKLTNERDLLQQEVHNLQHLLAAERRSLQTSEERRLRLMHTDSVTAAVPETELERKAWELYCRLDVDEEGAFRQAEKFIAERDRRRKESGK